MGTLPVIEKSCDGHMNHSLRNQHSSYGFRLCSFCLPEMRLNLPLLPYSDWSQLRTRPTASKARVREALSFLVFVFLSSLGSKALCFLLSWFPEVDHYQGLSVLNHGISLFLCIKDRTEQGLLSFLPRLPSPLIVHLSPCLPSLGSQEDLFSFS